MRLHTPDSSRFWLKDSYYKRLKKGKEPENFDKEFLRLRYFNELGYQGEGPIPQMPEDLIVDLSKRYVAVYEKITGRKFDSYKYPVEYRITKKSHNVFSAPRA